ncbi:MAG TPA: PQQ-binding-like beta-propeller repeat protein [Urbifossiella sp.]|jgi:outer membrane protein assembly factor BamB|nr:PQQ-binding-like beta-propeller repeat protein [Urbifossiella sp.]
MRHLFSIRPARSPIGVAVLTLALTPTLTLTGADWPQFHGPNRDNHSAETGLNWAWPAGGPPVAWSKAVGQGWAGPVVAGGKLILFHRAGDEEKVEALDPATGKGVWAFAYRAKYRDDFGFDEGPRATPTVSGDVVFTLGANGDLHAIELATGKARWHRPLLADYRADKGFFGVAGSPVVAGGRVLVNVGGKGTGVVAFDAAAGKEAWKATDDAAGYSSPVVAAVDGKVTAVFLTRDGLVGLDPATGAVRFAHPFKPRIRESVNAATPLVWNGDVFLTVSYGLGAALVRPKGADVEEVWANDRSLSCQYNTPVRVGEYLYGCHGRADAAPAELRCVEWKTGAVKWGQPRFGPASLIAVDGGLLALTERGELVRFDASPERYTERGRAAILGAPTRAAPALSGGRLYARDGAKLVCVDLRRE